MGVRAVLKRTTTDSTFQKVADIAQSVETAAGTVRKLQTPTRARATQPYLHKRCVVVVIGAGILTTNPPCVQQSATNAIKWASHPRFKDKEAGRMLSYTETEALSDHCHSISFKCASFYRT